MPTDGLFVQCHSWAPKQQNRPRSVSRVMCLAQAKDYCTSCPHSRFTVQMHGGVGQQTIACPRWGGDLHRYKNDMPSEYVLIPRETCLTTRPFEYCPSCPNAEQNNVACIEPGWYEQRQGKKGASNERRTTTTRGAK